MSTLSLSVARVSRRLYRADLDGAAFAVFSARTIHQARKIAALACKRHESSPYVRGLRFDGLIPEDGIVHATLAIALDDYACAARDGDL